MKNSLDLVRARCKKQPLSVKKDVSRQKAEKLNSRKKEKRLLRVRYFTFTQFF